MELRDTLIHPDELNARVVWQAIGNESKCNHGQTAFEAAQNFFAAFPRTRAPIWVREVIRYDYLDKDTGNLVPMHRVVFNSKSRIFREITKANYKELLQGNA
jgi:hypothetical protein